MIPCILSADDERESLNTHRSIMERYGFKVRHTTRLERMKKTIRANGIDSIHVDILFDPDAKQPDWDKPNGLSELSNALEGRKDIPVMVISGYIDTKAREKAEAYGLSDIIYKWYSKPVDYDLIAFDTIKAINYTKFKNRNARIINYIGKLEDNDSNILKRALKTMPVVKREIKLKPNLLVAKLENLAMDILVNFKSKDIINFKELIISHLYDYYDERGGIHLILAEHLVAAMSMARNEILFSNDVIEHVMDILKELGKEVLTEDDIYEAKVILEDTLKISLGLNMSSKDYDDYINLI